VTPPPLPDGCTGYPVAPDVHTGQPEPDRDDEERPLTFDEHCDNAIALTQPEATP
jgi:hypothetical protein